MGVFLEGGSDYLLEAMAVMNSSPFNFLLFMLCERRDPLFQTGKINSVPWPPKIDSAELSELAKAGYRDSACSLCPAGTTSGVGAADSGIPPRSEGSCNRRRTFQML